VLYLPEAFEPLTDEPWREERVRTAIHAVVTDADSAFDAERLWSADEWDAWGSPPPLKVLYVGAARVIWALDALTRRGYAVYAADCLEARTAYPILDSWD
jgi:hypothetical protein